MDYIELLIIIGLMVLITVAYFLLRKFIAWAIDDDNNFHKKRGGGSSKDSIKIRKDIALFRLTEGYAWIMLFLIVITVLAIINSK